MTVLSSAARYYLWLEPVDMRKSFNGLQGIVSNQLRRDALSGEVFIFLNRRRDQVSRKNYLFAGNHEAAQRNAMIYTLIHACKLHGVNPEVWLEDVLGRLHNHSIQWLEELLPHHWQPLQPGLKADPPRSEAET